MGNTNQPEKKQPTDAPYNTRGAHLPGVKVEEVKRDARRRFTKTAILAPFIVTLANRPAWGQSVSGNLSGTLSNGPEGDLISPDGATLDQDGNSSSTIVDSSAASPFGAVQNSTTSLDSP
jgi:hypothetical protein